MATLCMMEKEKEKEEIRRREGKGRRRMKLKIEKIEKIGTKEYHQRRPQ